MSTTETRPPNLSDAHITLSNEQLGIANPLQVCGGMTLASARFHAWYCAHASQTREELVNKRQAALDFFVEEYRKIFALEYDDYIKDYDVFKAQAQNRSEGR